MKKKTVKQLMQENENDSVAYMYDVYFHENYLTFNECLESSRLYHCSATIHRHTMYIHLTSYNTLIATYDIQSHALYDYLRYVYGYTSTSSQHISKFMNWLRNNGYSISNFYRWQA